MEHSNFNQTCFFSLDQDLPYRRPIRGGRQVVAAQPARLEETSPVANIRRECRKFGLRLVLCAQHE